ncbi:MAG TPA: MBL fold metallo-hydrolase, partial [Candidatus Limnocylindrales bacterium]|nr:MBL fold metallo-hydrolase [Candidatus Limnocylindrales bacterium]
MAKIVIEQVMSDLFRAEIPLPRNPLKATNSYIIKSNSRNLIIDTGMNREECKQAMSEVVRELDIDLHKTDFFITHLHADHVGLVNELAASDAAIYFNQLDADVLNYKNLWQMACVMAARNGFPAGDVDRAVNAHPGQRYSPHQPVNFKMITEEDTIVCGDFELQCIVTPGHTDGHTCLYEPNRKMFFSGDHILGDITPNISTLSDEGNPLADYLSSLDKVYQMPIELVLPGHRRIVNDCRKRIT